MSTAKLNFESLETRNLLTCVAGEPCDLLDPTTETAETPHLDGAESDPACDILEVAHEDSGSFFNDFTAEDAELYRANQERWGNYQGICGTALMEMARNFPDLYQQFVETEEAIEKWLNSLDNEQQNEQDGEQQDQEQCESTEGIQDLADEIGEDELAEMYRANNKKWGNYQGICGTALLDMAQNFPDLYQQFVETEAAIEKWLNNLDSEQQNEPDENQPDQEQCESTQAIQDMADEIGEDELAEMYRANHKKWGNYQGICGTALLDMARNFPDLYQQFLETEKAIEKWLGNRESEEQNQDQESPENNNEPNKPSSDDKEQSTSLPGDIDEDGQVSFSDFLILSSHFGTSTVVADLDGDGHVGFSDFLVLSQNFGRTNQVAETA